MNFKAMVAAPLAALLVMANAADLERINGWSTGSTGPSQHAYAIGIDAKELYQGKRVMSVKSMQKTQLFDYGSGSQALSAFGYAGKRLRFSALVKAEGLDNWAGVWMGDIESGRQEFFGKVMPHGAGYALPAAGAQPYWQPLSVVVDLPADAKLFQYGVVLAGNGQVWATDLKFEEVGTDVPLTATRVGIDTQRRDEAHLANMLNRPSAGVPHKKALPFNLELK